MDHMPERWGRPRDDVYGEYKAHYSKTGGSGPITQTQQPTVTGTSVLAMKFDNGVILAADNLASYGSLARFTDMERLFKVGEETIVGISGDVSDMQYIELLLERLMIEDNYPQDGHKLRAPHIYEYLSRVMYNRRSKVDPLWNAVLVAGKSDDGSPFLGYVDLLGVTYSSPSIATGFGAYLAIPLMRKVVSEEEDAKSVTEEQARAVLDQCMKVLFYRDARSLDKYSVATVFLDGNVKIEKDIKCQDMSWRFAKDISGYGATQL
ncbi:nucleophile aminohydrolase [Lipomyces oligophaga]|uniref:nucleophile aminohydrolase n=1 Tax=Lipomyces oligophaga TaxID=45792 RepID=UPI0034CE5F87